MTDTSQTSTSQTSTSQTSTDQTSTDQATTDQTGRDRPWEPPLAADETAHLLGALHRLRTTFRWKADGLDAAGLSTKVAASSLTLGALLKHLALVEDYYLRVKMRGESIGEPWASSHDGSDDWEFRTAADDTPEALYGVWDDAVERARAEVARALASDGLDQSVHIADAGVHANLRRLLFDLVEEYGRHTGHADLIREAVDGRTGEDPPDGWRTVSGRWVLDRP